MKLVREHIDEKFTSDSDPIHDLGIGIFKLDDVARKIVNLDIKREHRIDTLFVQKKTYVFHFFISEDFIRNSFEDNKKYLIELVEELGYMILFRRVGQYIDPGYNDNTINDDVSFYFNPKYKPLVIFKVSSYESCKQFKGR